MIWTFQTKSTPSYMQTRHGATASTEPDQKAEETQNSTIAQWMLIASARCRFVSLQGGGCALFMWATFPTVPDALRVMEAWGFAYKTAAFVWIKKYKSGGNFYGMGAYTRANAEVCLLGVTPGFKAKEMVKSHSVHQVIESPIQAHSVKPDETRHRIVELLGDVPRIELFARQRVPGWDAWGDEIEGMEE